MANYIVPISKGLLDPKHSTLVASPLGLFIFLIDRTTKEVRGEGDVLGGKPITHKEIADVLGANERSVRRWAEQLEDAGYIRTARTYQYGKLRWWVRKSKKFGRTKMATHARSDRTKMATRPGSLG
jgi:hypothetical protein